MTITFQILEAIKRERDRQDKKWGGPEHDDTHVPRDWIAFIVSELGHAGSVPEASEFERRMVRIAALAIAAAESARRFRARG